MPLVRGVYQWLLRLESTQGQGTWRAQASTERNRPDCVNGIHKAPWALWLTTSNTGSVRGRLLCRGEHRSRYSELHSGTLPHTGWRANHSPKLAIETRLGVEPTRVDKLSDFFLDRTVATAPLKAQIVDPDRHIHPLIGIDCLRYVSVHTVKSVLGGGRLGATGQVTTDTAHGYDGDATSGAL